ncbi:MAG: DUF4815 domain-containing protein [Alphaproteobacteria bacterium]|nr:DUF4815 domain-containing protein [Alphaproteobacteria bacterium]
MTTENFYNRFDSAKKYTKALFRSSQHLQAAELNEMQEYASHAIKEIGDALFKSGDVISGCTCVIDSDTGAVTVEAGKIYLNGLVRDVHEGNLEIPTNVSVKIGVYFKERTITELEDPDLRDPAVGTTNYQNPGAARLQYTTTWGYQLAETSESDSELGEFYTIYNVENGVLVQKALAPQLDSVSSALARYDDESNGSYVVKGMNVTCLSADSEEQIFSINEGKAHVNGYEVGLDHSLRSVFPNEYDIQTVDSDPYIFEPDALGNMTIHLNYTPLAEIKTVDVTAEKKVNLTHGSYSGAFDPIPSTAVLEIIQIKQGNTIYVKGTDYKLTAGQVDWSLSGSEPSPGSSYEIIYRHRTQLTPTNITDTSFDISGSVDGTMVLVTYSWKMPRYDIITIDAEGIVRRIKGLAHPWTPVIPKAPNGQLILAQIYQDWAANTKPKVTNNAIRVVQMADIESMKNMIMDLYYLIAQEQLKNDANASDPTAKKGIFVDPFFDDDMRDQGIAQTGAIVDNKLMLPITTEVHDFAKDQQVYMLPYTLEAVISQELQTGSMKINPYNAFDPIPADLSIVLNVDHWTEVQTQWLSAITYTYYSRGWGGSSSSNQLVSSSTKKIAYMRQQSPKFVVEGLKPGERISKIKFNGIEIAAREAE